ncbi:hypothetical protein [Leptospira noguchii]|uniref:hypothetical protein n=1 Tax=Leptospira noguchii TaxID=28182 RepID=UPI003B97C33E
MECISKGKSHKRCKFSLVTTSKSNWIVWVQALHGNPYDGHTLKDAINQMEKIVGLRPKEVYMNVSKFRKIGLNLVRVPIKMSFFNKSKRFSKDLY